MEEVLAAGDHPVHRLTGEVDGRKPRHPEVAALEHPAREGVVLRLRGLPDGVALGHR